MTTTDKNTPEENIDQLIREALSREDSQAYDDLGEQNVIDQALGALQGRNRALKVLMMALSFVFFALSVYSAFQFFAVDATKDLILWASAFFLFMMATTSIKMWWWMEMEKYATIREIKRVELQLANLTSLIANR